MRPEIELTEVSPGRWEFFRRLRAPQRPKPKSRDRGWDAEREAFFDSLASKSPIRTPKWWEGGVGFFYIFFGYYMLAIVAQALDKVILPYFAHP